MLSVIHFTLCPLETCGLWMVPKSHTDAFFISQFLMMAHVKLPPCLSWRHNIVWADEQLHSFLTSALWWRSVALIANKNMIFLFSDFQFISYSSSQVTHLHCGQIKRGYSDMWSMHCVHDTTNEFHFSADTPNLTRSAYLSIQSFQ